MSEPIATSPPVRAKRSHWFWMTRIILVAITALAVFLLWPSPVDPVAQDAPASMPLEGALAPNNELQSSELLAKGQIVGPEDVDRDDQGRIYAGTKDGRVVRILPNGAIETFATTGGRPLGMDFGAEGNLIVCDAINGLLSIDPKGKVTTLATEADGVPFGFTDDCEVADSGEIYFSDASSKFGEGEYMLDLLEGRPYGRLLVFDPETGKAKKLLCDLYFANGVAVAPDDEFVLVNETYQFRTMRYWLKGEKMGKAEVFIENLPGFPDGISSSPRGTYWLAMFTVRNPTADWLAPRPYLRKQMAKLPAMFLPQPSPYGFVIELDQNGKVLRSLHDPEGKTVSNITSVHEEDGVLYFGTLLNNYVGKWKLP